MLLAYSIWPMCIKLWKLLKRVLHEPQQMRDQMYSLDHVLLNLKEYQVDLYVVAAQIHVNKTLIKLRLEKLYNIIVLHILYC